MQQVIKKKGTLADYNSGNIAGKHFVFRLIRKNPNSSIRNQYDQPISYIGSFTIPNIAVIREENEKKQMIQKTIRYYPGESSIYKEEQSNDKDVPKKMYIIKFTNGRLIVPGDNKLLLDFMMKSNQNITNTNRRADVRPVFELVDNTIHVSKEIAKDKLIAEVTKFCWDGDYDEVKAYARVLNVNLEQSSDEIRHDLKVIGLRDPDKFLRDLKSPLMRKKHYVLEAIERGFLTIDVLTNSIAWKNNPYQPIAVAAAGMSIVDVLAQKLSTEEGALVYNALLEMLAPDEIVTAKLVAPSKEEIEQMKGAKKVVVEAPKNLEESDAELGDMIEKAVKLGIVAFKPPMWYTYKGENFKKKEGFISSMKNLPAIYKNLKYELEKAEATPVQN